MINCKKFSLSLPLLALASSISFPAYSAPAQVGKVIGVSGTAYAVPVAGGAKRALTRKSPIYAGEVLHTEGDGRVQLRFIDDALLTLKENTDYRVDSYHYDSFNPQKNKSEASLTKGGFWTVTGHIAEVTKEAYSVSTAYTTIGVRGTFFGVAIQGHRESAKKAHKRHKHHHHGHKKNMKVSLAAELEDYVNQDNIELGYNAGEAMTKHIRHPNPHVEVFAVFKGAISVDNSLTSEQLIMSPNNNQFMQLTGPRSEFEILPELPSGLNDFVNDPISLLNNKSTGKISTQPNSAGLENDGLGGLLASREVNPLIQNTTADLINPPGFPNTDANRNTPFNSTVLLSSDEILSLTNFGVAAMRTQGRTVVSGFSSGGGAGSPLITNGALPGIATQALNRDNALPGNISGCSNNVCFINISNQPVTYGSWSSVGTFNPVLRDGPNVVRLNSDVLWASGANPTTSANYETLRAGSFSRQVNFSGTPGFMLSSPQVSPSVNFTVNFANPTPTNISFNFQELPVPGFVWSGILDGRFENNRFVGDSFVNGGTVVNNGLGFNEPILSARAEIGFLGGDATAVIGAFDLVSATRRLDVVFGTDANP